MKKTTILLSFILLLTTPMFAQDIFTAIRSNDVPAVKFLLGKGVNADVQDAQGATPLINAVKNKQERVVLLLLQRNVAVDVQDNAGNTALILAAGLTGQDDMLNLLVHHYPKLDVKNNEGTTALMAAAKTGNTVAATYLLKFGADTQATDKLHKTAVDYAKEQHNAEIVALLNSRVSNAAAAGGK